LERYGEPLPQIQAERPGARDNIDRKRQPIGRTPRQLGDLSRYLPLHGENRLLEGIGWEIVTGLCKNLTAISCRISIPPRALENIQGFGKGFCYTLLPKKNVIDAGWTIRYYETPTSVKFDNGLGSSNSGKGSLPNNCNQIMIVR